MRQANDPPTYYYDLSMFTKLLALFVFPALATAVAQYGYGPGPAATTTSSGSATSATVAPTAPTNTPGQMNVCASFLVCSDFKLY